MFPRRRTASTVFVAAMCSWLLAATVAPSGQQSVTEETGRVVAIGDIHGDFDAFVSVLQEAGLVDTEHRWIGGAATLGQTGDFTDRGPGLRPVMDLLMEPEQAEAAGVPALGPGSPPRLLWAAPGEQVPTGEQSEPLPAEELPVSLERIKRKLAHLGPAQSSLLRLDYYVEVYGRAPKIDVLQAFDVHSGPVAYGAPTHAELLSLILPAESRTPLLLLSPGIDIIGWLLETGTSKESRGYQAAPALVSVAPGD